MLEMEPVFTVVACSVPVLEIIFDSDEVSCLDDQQDNLEWNEGQEGWKRRRRDRGGGMEGWGGEGRLVIAYMHGVLIRKPKHFSKQQPII